jgi:hypothetical protein
MVDGCAEIAAIGRAFVAAPLLGAGQLVAGGVVIVVVVIVVKVVVVRGDGCFVMRPSGPIRVTSSAGEVVTLVEVVVTTVEGAFEGSLGAVSATKSPGLGFQIFVLERGFTTRLGEPAGSNSEVELAAGSC